MYGCEPMCLRVTDDVGPTCISVSVCALLSVKLNIVECMRHYVCVFAYLCLCIIILLCAYVLVYIYIYQYTFGHSVTAEYYVDYYKHI